MQTLIPAHIQLDESGTPYAPDFADCYFSRQDGLAESRYVFLQGNQLPQRWQNQAQFVIAETGFGTGLNFLATWQAWQDDPQRCQRLHFISIEKHPIPVDQLRQLLGHWAELDRYAEELLANYPSLVSGFHRLSLAGGRITLTLCFMDIAAALPELVAQVDAWYLDGFAPARNPQMWQASQLRGIAVLSHSQTTLATFTAAGEVRRNLQAAGFTVSKRKGFGHKREMLTACLSADVPPAKQTTPWFALPSAVTKQQASVIGGGIAGCQIAHALAIRGWQVTLLERHASLATEASGNRAGVLIPKMTAKAGWGESFYQQAFTYAVRQARQLTQAGHTIDWQQCGSLQLAHEEREAARQFALSERGLAEDFVQILDAEAASEVAGIALSMGGSYFPQAAWLNPRSLCQALVAHPNIQVQPLTAMTQFDATEGVHIVASGRDANRFTQTASLPFMPVMGQTSYAQATAITQQLRTTLGHEGYLTPAWQGSHVFGATFARDVYEPYLQTSADTQNWQQLARYLPEFAQGLGKVRSGHAAIRMTTLDRYPMVGALADEVFFQQVYERLRHGVGRHAFPAAQYMPNVFILAGFGSRGLATSGLCAEVLAAQLCAEPLPIQRTLYQNLHPARFLIRHLRKA